MKTERREKLGGLDSTTSAERERERELLSRIRDGDRQAREDLVLGNLGLVAAIAGEYKPRGMDLDDLIQEGTIALIGAVERFDAEASSLSFAAFAARAIHQRLQRVLAESGSMIRVPYYLGLLRRRFDWIRTRMLNERRSAGDGHADEPTVEEVAERMGVEVDRLANLRDAGFAVESYSDALNDGDETLNEALAREEPPELPLEVVEAMTEVFAALKRLSRFEAWVIKRLYYLDGSPAPTDRRLARPYRDLSRECRLPVPRIKQIEREALDKLAAALEPSTLNIDDFRPSRSAALAG